MNTFSIFPILTLLFCIWCWVASPQSNSQTSPLNLKASDEWFRVDEGWAAAGPKNVIFSEESATGSGIGDSCS